MSLTGNELIGQIKAERVQLLDSSTIADPSAELNELAGSENGSIAIVGEVSAGNDEFTGYIYDEASTASENVPYSIDAAGGGMWLAAFGKYSYWASTLPMYLYDIDGAGKTDAAITAVVDAYSGVIATTTQAGTTQTMGAPTDTTPGKRFWIVNDDASTQSFTASGARDIVIDPGEAEQYMWDGTAWIHITAADAEDITLNPAASYLTSTNIQGWFDATFKSDGLHIDIDDASNSSVSKALTLRHSTTGTAGDGIGTRITYESEDDIGTISTMGYLDFVFNDVSDGSEKSEFNVYTRKEGSILKGMALDEDAMLDLHGGTISILAGADGNLKTRTDATSKFMRFGAPHYTNTEEPFGLFYGFSSGSENALILGGGMSTMNASTSVRVYVADDQTTVTGTEVARFEGGATKASMMGLGNSTLESWDANYSVLQLGGNASLIAETSAGVSKGLIASQNAYYDGAWKYISTDEASRYTQVGGGHIFVVATSGSADAGMVGNETTALTIANDASSTFGGAVTVDSTTSNLLTLFRNAATGDSLIHFKNTDVTEWILGMDDSFGFVISESSTVGTPRLGVTNGGDVFVAHDKWFKGIDNAGTDYVNMFKVNAGDEIEVGGTLLLGGSFEAGADSGAISLFNMPVTSTPNAGDEMSASMMIDSEVVAKFFALADGTGGISNRHFIQSVNTGITADTGSAQGGSPLGADINEISTCANAGDSVTLPNCVAGMEIFIVNNGANSCDVFPASGDNLGAGVDTASALASGSNITYVSYDGTNWEQK